MTVQKLRKLLPSARQTMALARREAQSRAVAPSVVRSLRCASLAGCSRAQLLLLLLALAAPALSAAQAAAPASPGTCFIDKHGSNGGWFSNAQHSGSTVTVCNTAAVHNASVRCALFLAAILVVVALWGVVFTLRRHAAVRAVFASHAAALRARAAGVAPGSAERAALEAEAADVEAAAGDWQRIAKDEEVLAAPTRVGGSFFTNTADKKGSYTVAAKEEASNERTALLSKHGVSAFAGAREEAHRSADFWRDGLYVVPLAAVLLGALAYASSVARCETPLYQLCLKSTPATYTCAFNAAGACVATPL